MNVILAIKGQTPAKKNGKQLVYVGGKPRFIPSKVHSIWEKDALKQLLGIAQFQGKVAIAYRFYVKDLRPRDTDNMIASVNDALVKAGILVSDSWQNLAIASADAELDRDDPRVELFITKVENNE